MELFLCSLGIALILEGLPYFAIPARLKTYLLKVAVLPDGSLRIMGLISMAAGLLLVYLGRMA